MPLDTALVVTGMQPAYGTNYSEQVVGGYTNAEDYVAMTNPFDFYTTQRVYETVGMAVIWQSASGRWYRLDASTNLTWSFGLNIKSNIPAFPPMNTETDTTATGKGARFYRVGVEAP